MKESQQTQPRQHYAITLAVLSVAALAYALSQTMVIPALPGIQKELHTSPTGVTWVLTVYLLTASLATPIVGRLGDIFGKERMLVITLACFGTGSLIAALSHSIGVLILGRAVQGIGGAVFPLSFGIIRDEFPREKVAAGIGLISATFGIGGGAGLVLSGVIVEQLSYEWIFWLALVVVVIAIVATFLFIPESPIKTPAKIDWPGAGLLSLGLGSLLLGVSQGNNWGWGSVGELGLFAFALLALTVWVRFEWRVKEPLVDMRMMRDRTVFTTNLTAFLIGFGMFGSFILIPELVEIPTSSGYGFGASVIGAGLFLMPSTVMMLFAGPVAGMVAGRFGSKLPLAIGTLLAAISFIFIAFLHDQRWAIYFASTLLGLGIGFSFASMPNLIVEAVDETKTGVATGMNTIMRTIGGSIGGQIAASILAGNVIGAAAIPAESGFTLAFAMFAGVVLVAFISALAIPSRRNRNALARAVA